MKSSSKRQKSQNSKNNEDICNYAFFLLAIRDYSKHEIGKKLKLKFSVESVNRVVEDLEGRGLISDERYAEKIIQKYAFLKKFGYLKVEAELFKRGIDKTIFKNMLDTVYTPLKEKENAISFLNKKPPDKIYNYLLSRGFRSYIVQEVLAENKI
jgi:SOS response regulatory protein OraA/RecX